MLILLKRKFGEILGCFWNYFCSSKGILTQVKIVLELAWSQPHFYSSNDIFAKVGSFSLKLNYLT